MAATVGATAAVVAVVLGAVMSTHEPTREPPLLAQHITVTRSTTAAPAQEALPLSDPQIAGLLKARPDLGPLADRGRRESCLRGLGYPGRADILGARALTMDGRSAVMMLLAGDTPDEVTVYVVDPGCRADHTGLLAHREVPRP